MGSSVTVLESQSRLVVTSPFSIWLMLGLAVFTIWPLVILLSAKPLAMRKALIFGAFCILVYGFLPSYTRLTLDQTQDTAVFHKYTFYHFVTMTYPLSDIASASVRTGSTTDSLQVQLEDGSMISFSELNQANGKNEAAFAINKFLGVSGSRHQ